MANTKMDVNYEEEVVESMMYPIDTTKTQDEVVLFPFQDTPKMTVMPNDLLDDVDVASLYAQVVIYEHLDEEFVYELGCPDMAEVMCDFFYTTDENMNTRKYVSTIMMTLERGFRTRAEHLIAAKRYLLSLLNNDHLDDDNIEEFNKNLEIINTKLLEWITFLTNWNTDGCLKFIPDLHETLMETGDLNEVKVYCQEATIATALDVTQDEKMPDRDSATDKKTSAGPIVGPKEILVEPPGPRPVSSHGRKTPSKSQPVAPKETPSGTAIVDGSPLVKKPKTTDPDSAR